MNDGATPPGSPAPPAALPLPPPAAPSVGGALATGLLAAALVVLWIVTGLGRTWRDPPTAVAAAVVFRG